MKSFLRIFVLSYVALFLLEGLLFYSDLRLSFTLLLLVMQLLVVLILPFMKISKWWFLYVSVGFTLFGHFLIAALFWDKVVTLPAQQILIALINFSQFRAYVPGLSLGLSISQILYGLFMARHSLAENSDFALCKRRWPIRAVAVLVSIALFGSVLNSFVRLNIAKAYRVSAKDFVGLERNRIEHRHKIYVKGMKTVHLIVVPQFFSMSYYNKLNLTFADNKTLYLLGGVNDSKKILPKLQIDKLAGDWDKVTFNSFLLPKILKQEKGSYYVSDLDASAFHQDTVNFISKYYNIIENRDWMELFVVVDNIGAVVEDLVTKRGEKLFADFSRLESRFNTFFVLRNGIDLIGFEQKIQQQGYVVGKTIVYPSDKMF